MKCFCFTYINPKTKKISKVCFCPPVLINRFRKPIPKEDPRWLEIEGIKAQDIDDLAVLSNLSVLTEALSPALAKRLQAPIEEMLQAQLQKLPVEITVEKHSVTRKRG